MKDFPLTFKSS